MMSHSESLWDVYDLSRYLKVKVKTIYHMLRDLPHYRLGRLIRFNKQEIDLWLESKRQIAKKAKKPGIQNKREKTDINRLIRKVIDREKGEMYNPSHGQSDQIKGLGKEVSDGII